MLFETQTFRNEGFYKMLDSQTKKYKYKDDPICKNIRDYILNNDLTDLKFVSMLNEIIEQEGNPAIKPIKRSTVNNWKNGVQRPNEKIWKYIAKLMGILIDELTEEKGYEKSLELKKELKETKITNNNLKKENTKLKREVTDKKLKDIELEYAKKSIKLYEEIQENRIREMIEGKIDLNDQKDDDNGLEKSMKIANDLAEKYQTDDNDIIISDNQKLIKDILNNIFI